MDRSLSDGIHELQFFGIERPSWACGRSCAWIVPPFPRARSNATRTSSPRSPRCATPLIPGSARNIGNDTSGPLQWMPRSRRAFRTCADAGREDAVGRKRTANGRCSGRVTASGARLALHRKFLRSGGQARTRGHPPAGRSGRGARFAHRRPCALPRAGKEAAAGVRRSAAHAQRQADRGVAPRSAPSGRCARRWTRRSRARPNWASCGWCDHSCSARTSWCSTGRWTRYSEWFDFDCHVTVNMINERVGAEIRSIHAGGRGNCVVSRVTRPVRAVSS